RGPRREPHDRVTTGFVVWPLTPAWRSRSLLGASRNSLEVPPMLNLAVLLEDSARAVPDRDAVVHSATRISYSHLDAAASQVAAALAARGIARGDRVALSCPNLPYFPIVYYGILKSGATVVPMNVLLTEREIAYHLDDSAAKAYFCFEGTAELPLSKA